MNLSVVFRSSLLLISSNIFMTFAWYGHLRTMSTRPWIVAALVNWGIALFEYLLQVPANRIGATTMALPPPKMLQEIITLSVFVPFTILFLKQQVRLDFHWVECCMAGAVYFVFRGAPAQGVSANSRRKPYALRSMLCAYGLRRTA